MKIISENKQAKGVFAGGLILENKPIGFPQDGGIQKPYSNLFYWANAWSEKGGLIPEHPHKMFEIMSIVIEGEIQHYDSKNNDWFTLKAGDAQIIRAGSGITHAERLMENSRIFQIWFDPNIQETMTHSASYNDYKASEIPEIKNNGVSYKNYIGNGGPVKMESEGVEINEILMHEKVNTLRLNDKKVYSYYVLKGLGTINGQDINEHDFIIIEDSNEISIELEKELKLFEIATPKKLSYKTYNELVKF